MYKKNIPDWIPSEDDYTLVFMEVKDPDGWMSWREVSHNLAKYSNILLSEYLLIMKLYIPDYTQFLRIINREDNYHFEYRSYGGRVRIDYHKLEY